MSRGPRWGIYPGLRWPWAIDPPFGLGAMKQVTINDRGISAHRQSCGPRPLNGSVKVLSPTHSGQTLTTFGALFCTFNVDGDPTRAECHSRDIRSRVPDRFKLINRDYRRR